MSLYRLYILTRQDRVSDERQRVYDDDKAALADGARLRRSAYAVEVWEGERLVGRLGGEFRIA